MKHQRSSYRVLMAVCLVGYFAPISSAALCFQSGQKSATFDPYFNSKNVSESPVVPATNKIASPVEQNQDFDFALPPESDFSSASKMNESRLANWQPPAADATKTVQATQKSDADASNSHSLWVAPRTPVDAGLTPRVAANSLVPTNSFAATEASPHSFRSPEATSPDRIQSIIQENVRPASLSTSPDFTLLTPTTGNRVESKLGSLNEFDPPQATSSPQKNAFSGGEFTADLSGLTANQNKSSTPMTSKPTPTFAARSSELPANGTSLKPVPPSDAKPATATPHPITTAPVTTAPIATNSLSSGPPSTKPLVATASTDAKSESDFETFEPTRLMAMVGNEPIFVGDMLLEVNQLVAKFMPTAPQSVKDAEGEKLLNKLLPKFIDSKMLYVGMLQQLPEKADIKQIIEQAAKEFDENAMPKMMEASNLKTTAEFDAHLRAQGSSLRKFRLSWSQDQLTKYFLSQQLNVDKEVSHQAMLQEYQRRIETYAVPAKARWEQVMIRFDRCESRMAAKTQLAELGNQIVYGASFSAVAQKSSHGFSAAAGGQHDWTSKNALALKELDEAIFSLPIGELSDLIETREGYHIVRVHERTEATHKSFLEAQAEIKEDILDQKREAAFKKHLEKLRRDIRVEYFVDGALLP